MLLLRCVYLTRNVNRRPGAHPDMTLRRGRDLAILLLSLSAIALTSDEAQMR